MENYREYLNEIDMKCIDENLHFYDLRSLYESTVPNLSPEDKQELKKVLDSTNDPEIIAAALTAKATKDKNESLDEDSDNIESIKTFEVFLDSGNGTQKRFDLFDDEMDAEDFCNRYDWHWTDENGFDWHLDYREIEPISRVIDNESLKEEYSYNPDDEYQELFYKKLIVIDDDSPGGNAVPIYGYEFKVFTDNIMDDLYEFSSKDESDEASSYYASLSDLDWREKDVKIDEYLKANFNRLFEKYEEQLLDKYEYYALEQANEDYNNGLIESLKEDLGIEFENFYNDFESIVKYNKFKHPKDLVRYLYNQGFDDEYEREYDIDIRDEVYDWWNDTFGTHFRAYFDESLNEDSLAKPFKKEFKNAYKSFDRKRDFIRKKNADIDSKIPNDLDADDAELMKDILHDKEPKWDSYRNNVVNRMQGLEKNEYPFYVTYYVESPHYHPEEGGYYVASVTAASSEGYNTKQEARQAAAELADELGFEKLSPDSYRLYSKYIGDSEYIYVESANDYLGKEKGDQAYESLHEAKFGPYNYRYEAHWISPEGKDILLGANNDFEAVENIAINQIETLLENPWESNENKYKIIDSLYIYDSEKDDADVMGISLEDYIDGILSELDSRIRSNSLDEDTIKQNGKWVNKGKEGTHGTFKTKKEADAQRKAMFAQGYKESLSNTDPDKYDELVNKVFNNIKSILHDENYKKDLSQEDLEYLGKLISKKYFTEGLQDIQNDFANARKNWDSLGFNISFDDALEKYNDKYGEERFYAKPIYDEEAWNKMIDMFSSKNESLTEDIYEDDDGDYDDNEFEKGRDGCFYKQIAHKMVYDSDGFTTDYTLYMKAEPTDDRFEVSYVTVFGDNELYRPDDGGYDYETDDLDNAFEWFESYNGFEDELDESWTPEDSERLVDENGYVDINNITDYVWAKYDGDLDDLRGCANSIINTKVYQDDGKVSTDIIREFAGAHNLEDRGFDESLNESKRLNKNERQIYINAIKEAEDIEDLEDIAHEIFFYDKPLFVQLRHFPKDKSFEEIRDRMIDVLNSDLDETLNEALWNEYRIDFIDTENNHKYSEEYQAWNSKEAISLFRADYPQSEGYKFLKLYKLTDEGYEEVRSLDEDVNDFYTNFIDTNDNIEIIDEFLNKVDVDANSLLDYKNIITDLYNAYVEDYKKFPNSRHMDSLDAKYNRDHGRFYKKWRPVIDKCKDILKKSSVTGYGKYDYFVLKLIDMLKGMEYNFPYGWKSDASLINEDYQHIDDEWGEPYTYKEVEDDLKSLTNNWQDKDGIVRCYWEQEKEYGKQILEKHYEKVEVSDGRTGKGENMSWAISYADPKQEIAESLDDNYYELLNKIWCTFPDLSEDDEDYFNSLTYDELVKEVKNRGWESALFNE